MKTKSSYDHKAIERKWQKKWSGTNLYSPDILKSKKPFYNLFMFPYPSAEGMHAGHALSSTGSDIYGRFMRMNGQSVFQPMGYDSFGIHSENYAIKIGEHPQTMLNRAIKHYEEQFKSFGHGYDWTRTLTTSDVDYYKWTQWLFVQLFKAGLAYRKKAEVNWCPGCKTVLADEQIMTPAQAAKIPVGYKSMDEVPEGIHICERCGNIPEKKELEQWFFKITDYADRLLDNLKKIDWSEKIKIAQHNWIGKSQGMLIGFNIEGEDEEIKVFTTRPDTLNGATFIALADDKLFNEHETGKHGEFTDKYAINPLNNKKLPIWKTNYVASGYGTGAIMGVPAHDERDMEFAKKYHLDIADTAPDKKLWDEIEKKNWGKKHTNYHLRDWLISRQRYWGPPIPMIYCQKCAKEGKGWLMQHMANIHSDYTDWNPSGWYPVEELPVELPNIKDFKPGGAGKGPLANHPEFYKVKCPHCGAQAVRETDVSDTFVDSAWYFLRYPTVDAKTAGSSPFDPTITKKWLPVNLYFGGAEHAVLHLMYARFITMVLYDLKKIPFEEPFTKFFAHGLMIKDGAKMSKSRGNVVNPDEYVAKFGADTLRMYLVFIGPMDASPDFRDTGIEGMHRFIKRVWNLYQNENSRKSNDWLPPALQGVRLSGNSSLAIKIHQTIKRVTHDIENFHYNTAIAAIMEYVNFLRSQPLVSHQSLIVLAQLIAPFAPHLAEEVWQINLKQKGSVHTSSWPQFDQDIAKESQIVIAIQVNGKLRSQLTIDSQSSTIEDKIVGLAKKDEKVVKWLAGKKIKKTIFVSGKIVNFVVV